ncbi:TetR/AcrR family transcriptional regulator [Streptomyces sp. JNUCC 64]
MNSSPSSRGRPRDPRSHEAIVSATVELVTGLGYAATSIGAVAARAGVGKDTVYRRWRGKPELVYEAVFTTTDHTPVPDTGTLTGDLTALLRGLVDEFRSPAAAAALPGLLADFAADPELRERIRGEFLAPSKARLLVVFERAVARGEVAAGPPVDLLLDTLAGAVFFHVGLVGEDPDPLLADRLAAVVARGVEVREATAGVPGVAGPQGAAGLQGLAGPQGSAGTAGGSGVR